MNPINSTHNYLRLTLAISIGGLCPFPLIAQEDAGGAAPAVFELSPFEVNASNDRGYTATSSLAGGRLTSELRDTAAAVSVLTTEFMNDIGAVSFLEAAKWAPNSIPVEEVSGASLYNDYSVQFRSLGAGYQSRNYFRWYINSDAYNTSRIEFSRGPNSLVFGDAGVGGVANVSSLQAQGSGQSTLQFQINSFGGYRGTFDTDLKVNEEVSVRVAGVHQRFDDWRDFGEISRDGVFLTTTYRPTSRTQIRAEGEWGQSDRVLSFGILENYSAWDGVTFIDGPIPNGTSLGTLRRNNSDRLVFNSAAPEQGIVNWKEFGATFGTFRMLTTYQQEGLPDSLVLDSYEQSFQAPNGGVENPYYTASLFFQHQFGNDLFLELATNYQEQERLVKRWFFDGLGVEVNSVLPNGQPNPNFGELFGEARYWQEDQKNAVFDMRASLAYIYNRSFTEQRFLVTAGQRDDGFSSIRRELVRTNGSDPKYTSAVNRIFARRYASDLFTSVMMPPAVDPVSGIETKFAQTDSYYSDKPITYFQGAIIGKWFENRNLNTLFGVRRDKYREEINERQSNVIDPVTREFLELGRRVVTTRETITSYTYSGVYHLTDAFSVFAGYSESFDPGSTALGIDGFSLPSLLSSGREAGIKLNLWSGRLVGSVTYYENEQENARIAGESGNINNIWGLLDLDDNQVDNYRDRQTFKGSGIEFDFTAMPTPNWRLMFNLALPDTELTDGLIDTRNYYNENIDFWNSELQRLEDAGETLTADAIANAISGIESRIDSFESGRRLNDTFKYTANVFSRYYFDEGRLEGFSVGGGANFRGERLVANEPGDPYDYVYAKDYILLSLVLGYDMKVGKTDLSFQFNISNLLDKEIVRPTSYGTYRAGTETFFVPDRFHVQDPRKVLFTVSGRF